MSPEQTSDESTPPEPAPSEEPPPPPPDAEPPETVPAEKKPAEDIWKDDYEEFVEAEETPKPKRRKSNHWGAIIFTAAVIVFIVVWTIASPRVMDEVSGTYVDSPAYASWGNYTGSRDIWAGNMTWGVSVSGHQTSSGNRSIALDVLITKVYEKPGNWFFRGTAIQLRNVSVYTTEGTYLASMTNKSDLGFGISAHVPITFADTGNYSMYVTAKFLVYEVMRIGFIPLETVNIEAVYLNFPVEVV